MATSVKLGPLVACLLLIVGRASAFDLQRLSQYVGYSILGVKTIAGYSDKDGKSKEEFDGCDFGRTIAFSDNTYAKCAGYGYQYAYRPEVLLLARGGSLVMIVEGTAYQMNFQ